MTQLNALTALGAKHADAGRYCDGQRLWLCKRRKDRGSWIVRLNIAGKRREMGLGPWPDVSISEARDRAADARRLLRDGVNPIERDLRVNVRHPISSHLQNLFSNEFYESLMPD
ncbi:MAG: DUF4102 domain-containing protein [Rhizobiaceae bacterium]|nr:DUF4102 domain-containing protein [Rhizobiaceae bacterium]